MKTVKLFIISTLACFVAACHQPAQNAANGDIKLDGVMCAAPAETLKTQIQSQITEQIRILINQNGNPNFDRKKAENTLDKLTYQLNNISAANNLCQADIKITFPTETIDTATTNLPILYPDTPLGNLVSANLGNSGVSYDNAGIFGITLQFAVQQPNNDTVLLALNNNSTLATPSISAAAHSIIFSASLKNKINLNGKTLTLQEALAIIERGAEIEDLDAASEAENKPNEAIASESKPAQTEAKVASAEVEKPKAEEQAPKVEEKAKSDETVQEKTEETSKEQPKEDPDLIAKIGENQAAEAEINRLWKNMDKTVQQGLLEEQRAWIQLKKGTCRKQAANASKETAESVRVECETQMTRERTEYLRGYSVD